MAWGHERQVRYALDLSQGTHCIIHTELDTDAAVQSIFPISTRLSRRSDWRIYTVFWKRCSAWIEAAQCSRERWMLKSGSMHCFICPYWTFVHVCRLPLRTRMHLVAYQSLILTSWCFKVMSWNRNARLRPTHQLASNPNYKHLESFMPTISIPTPHSSVKPG